MSDNRSVIRQTILALEKPFCISDLFIMLGSKDIKERDLILEVLDELYDRGLVDYRRREGVVDNPKWAFFVA